MKILVLDACALHLGYLGCYGCDWVATPALDRLACESVVFDQHFADDLDPIPNPGETTKAQVGRLLIPALEDFADQVLAHLDRWAGAEQTLLRIDGPLLTPPWRLPGDLLGSYFDEEEGILPEPWPDPPQGCITLADEDLLRLQNSYAAVISVWDAQLERILDHLDKQPWADDLLLVVTARSGLPLGEHGQIGFAHPWLHEELVHVPLVLRFPERRHSGRRIAALTGSHQLTDALDAWQGIASAQESRLLQLLQDDREMQNAEIVSRWRLGQEEEWSARTAEWALIWPRTATDRPIQLYARPDDRWEVNNLAHQHHELVEQWQRRLEPALAAAD